MKHEKGIFKIEGILLELLKCEFSFSRKTLTNGLPVSKIYGGTITLFLN